MLEVEVAGTDGRAVRLCDFAYAGARGTRYRSWLAASPCPPSPVVTRLPADATSIPAGRALLRWRVPRPARAAETTYRVLVKDASEDRVVLDQPAVEGDRLLLADAARHFAPGAGTSGRSLPNPATEAPRPAPGPWPGSDSTPNCRRCRTDSSRRWTNRPDGLLLRARARGVAGGGRRNGGRGDRRQAGARSAR